MSDVTLSLGIRNNLLSLTNNKSLIDRTQNRLSTGLKVASPIDDAVAYFASKSLSDRATDMSARKDAIDQGVSSVTTALDTMESTEDLLKQMKGILDAVRSGTAKERKEYGEQLYQLGLQVQKLVNDASYKGLNLVNSSASNLTVYFSEKTDSRLDVQGVDFTSSGLYLNSAGAGLDVKGSNIKQTDVGDSAVRVAFLSEAFGFSVGFTVYSISVATAVADLNKLNSKIDIALTRLDTTISNVRAKAATMGANVAILNVRLDFTSNYVNTLQGGADKLTVADLNTEGANLVALQTRQQMGISSLAFAGQMDQSVLRLLQ